MVVKLTYFLRLEVLVDNLYTDKEFQALKGEILSKSVP